MTEKTFVVTMYDESSCDYREYRHMDRLFFCARTDFKPCGGDLIKRPDYCPLVEVQEPVDGMVPANKKIWVEK